MPCHSIDVTSVCVSIALQQQQASTHAYSYGRCRNHQHVICLLTINHEYLQCYHVMLHNTVPAAPQVPASINQYLRDYQREGVLFLFQQYAAGLGGVLADDMGLGKTVQTIAFMAALLGKSGTLDDEQLGGAQGVAAVAHKSKPVVDKMDSPHKSAQQRGHKTDKDIPPVAEQASGGGLQITNIVNLGVNQSGEADQQHLKGGTDKDPKGVGVVRQPILVVSPTSVMLNWLKEINTWSSFKVSNRGQAGKGCWQQGASMMHAARID